ncbi:MAG: ABC transporter ATP-binding protein/permease [Candidatus Cloacimonetes bacterium]|nr:ABC transporter ATP-binding protein/permease [Candidatus Cloacimonadota bacterium]
MQHFKGQAEDNLNSKIYDRMLYKKLLRYMKPYRAAVLISFILLLLITVAELALPMLIKHVVDEYVTSNKSMITFQDLDEYNNFVKENEGIKLIKFQENGNFYIIVPNKKLNFINTKKLELIKSEKRLLSKIIVLGNNPEIVQILQDAKYYILSKDKIAIEKELIHKLNRDNTLSREDLQTIFANNIENLHKFGILALIILILQFLFSYFQLYSINHASQHAMYNLRRDVFSHLSYMPLSFFDQNPIGRLVTRVTNDVRTLDEMLSNGLIQLVQQFMVLGGIIVMMLIVDLKLALVTFSILPIVIILFSIFIKKTRIIYRDVRKKVAQINASLSENISGVKIIQLFNQYNRKVAEFTKINQGYYEQSMKQLKLFAFFRPTINSMRRLAIALILWFGGVQIMQDRISLGVFILFLSYIDRFFEPINHLSEKFNILQAAMAGSERIFDLMSKKKEDYRTGNHSNERLKGEIEFKNIWLRYNDNGDVLKNISFKVNQGEKVAIVGHTGSGKTSIISLIAGLYPFQKGEILIDNKDIKDFSLFNLRNEIGIVQQDVFLFSGTIKDNIVLNNKSLSDEDMKKYAEYVNVDKFINTLPQKYQDPVMERGSTFSVGQRQLIAFARVLAYDPAIFVLDEATSNIDTETEILIQDALGKVMKNRTSIIIAHRLSTIQHCDRIIVLHKGEIREEGSHQELLTKEGLYYDLYRLQYA